jgi:hypothetical protein
MRKSDGTLERLLDGNANETDEAVFEACVVKADLELEAHNERLLTAKINEQIAARSSRPN